MSATAETRPYSLRRRLMIAATAAFAVLIAVLSIGLWTYARSAANETYDLLLRGAAISVLERITLTPEGVDIDLPPSALDILALAESDRVFYRILDREGRTLTGTPDLPLDDRLGPDLPSDEPIFFDHAYSGETVRFVVHGRTLLGSADPQWVGVQIGQTRRARVAMQNDLILKGLVPLAALSLAGIAWARAGIGLAMRPLSGIERDIRMRQPSDLEPLRAVPPREVESLIASINGFMLRLKHSKGQAESFIADVAHQIRTSLATLNSQLQMAVETDDLRSEASILRARDQAARTIRLTNQLLSHAMVIHRADEARLEPVDLALLLRQLLEEAIRAEGAAEIEFAVDLPPSGEPFHVHGDAIAIREAMRNLLDNAVRHSPAGGAVTLSAAPAEIAGRAAMALSIEDTGPGIPADERAKVVERFYTRGSHGGSGLGLSIAASVAASHDGRLDLGQSAEGGLKATLVLPIAPRGGTLGLRAGRSGEPS